MFGKPTGSPSTTSSRLKSTSSWRRTTPKTTTSRYGSPALGSLRSSVSPSSTTASKEGRLKSVKTFHMGSSTPTTPYSSPSTKSSTSTTSAKSKGLKSTRSFHPSTDTRWKPTSLKSPSTLKKDRKHDDDASSTSSKASKASKSSRSSHMKSAGGGGGGSSLATYTAMTHKKEERRPSLRAACALNCPPHSLQEEAKIVGKRSIEFNVKDFVFSTTVGTGTFGRVRLVQEKSTGRYFVLKILKKTVVIKLKQVEHVKNEVLILGSIHHPFIVNMYGFRQDPGAIYMLMDYVPGGELFSHLRREGRFSNDAAKFYAAEIIMAFQYLHHFDVVYRDLKPENLLLTKEGHIKITDFGFAKIVQDRTWTLCGTPEYLAPEIIQSKGHGKSVDWWAIGILIYEMLAGYPPFFDDNPMYIYRKILENRVEFPKHFDLKAKDIIRRFLNSDRSKRLGCLKDGAEDVMCHRWFGRLNWDAVYHRRIPAPFVPSVKGEGDTHYYDRYPDSREGPIPLSDREDKMFEALGQF